MKKKPWVISPIFDEFNPRWDRENRRQNPLYVQWVQDVLNDRLRVRGYVSANEALELLGFERTVKGGQAGWIRGEGDGRIHFGIWNEGFDRGRDWIQGNLDAITLYFNVDQVTESMPRRVKRLKEEGKL